MTIKYTFICNDEIARSKVTIETETSSLMELISLFEDFLRASRFSFNGYLDIVENEPEMPSDKNDVFGHIVNQHIEGIDSSEKCDVCGISKSLMETQRCWDKSCPKKEEHANQG